MPEIDPYDLPPHPDSHELSVLFGNDLTKGDRIRAYIYCAAILIVGLVLQFYAKDWLAFSRSGALVTLVSILQVRTSLKWSRYEPKIYELIHEVYTKIESDSRGIDIQSAKAIAKKRIDRVIPGFFQEIQRSILPTQLATAAIGTLVWGFGDLIVKFQ